MSKETRRSFIKKGTLAVGSCMLALNPMVNQHGRSGNQMDAIPTNDNNLALPTPAQAEWQDAEVGMIFHFDISVAAGAFESGNNVYRKVFDPQQYNPEKLDTDQWIATAKVAGAKYAIFTATHFCGFMQWQSDLYPYGLKQAKWKNGQGDIVEDFVNSCYKAGIKPGIYLSTHRNAYWHVDNHYVDWGKGKGTKKQVKYNRTCENIVEELCSRYGPLVEIWFDAGIKTPEEGGPDVLLIVNEYQPDTVFYSSSKRAGHRWVGNESGHADYPCWATMPDGYPIAHNASSWKSLLAKGCPNGQVWSPAMVDVPLRGANRIHDWFWQPGQAQGAYSSDQLTDIYYQSVGRNCNLVIGTPINPEGLVPDHDKKRLGEFGNEIKRLFNDPIAETRGVGNKLVIKVDDLQTINTVLIQEQIEYGERIRSFVVEGHINNSWKELCDGKSIGHKYLKALKPVKVDAVRIKINKSVKTPVLRRFAVFVT